MNKKVSDLFHNLMNKAVMIFLATNTQIIFNEKNINSSIRGSEIIRK
jgi:hypothetical protein